MIRFFFLFLCFTPNLHSQARELISGPVLAEVVRVRDGDSIDVVAKIWPGNDIRVSVRIRGIDAPELRARCDFEKQQAQAARNFLSDLLSENTVQLSRISGGKYFGRVLADVQSVSGRNIKSEMLKSGLVRTYHGKKRQSWCLKAAYDEG